MEKPLDKVRAIHWEQGTGKSWLGMATAEKLKRENEIDAMFILAPPGLHRNWVNYEIPDHFDMPNATIAFQSKKAKTKKHHKACSDVLNASKDYLPILAQGSRRKLVRSWQRHS